MAPEPKHDFAARLGKLEGMRAQLEAKTRELAADTQTWDEEERWLRPFEGNLEEWIAQVQQRPRPSEYKEWRREIKKELRAITRALRADPRLKRLEERRDELRRRVKEMEARRRKAERGRDPFWYVMLFGITILIILVFLLFWSGMR